MLHPPAHHRGTAPMTRDEISSLLEKNQISMRPDDGAAISVIEKYVNGDDGETPTAAEEMTALDAAIDEAADAAESVYRDAEEAINDTAATIRRLLDGWNARAVLRDFAFSYSAEERRYVVNSFIDMCPRLRNGMSEMSVLSGRAGEAATMLRDCSAKAQMLASELKYASLAAWICEDPALAEERQALSDETRERAMAADKLAAEIMRVIRSLSVSMSAVSAAVPQASAALHIDSAEGEAAASMLISPKRAAAALSGVLTAIGAASADQHIPD